MDKFDNLIKDAVEGYEAPYDAQAWANVSSQLGPKGGPMKWIVGTAAVATILVGTVYFMQEDEKIQNNPVVANQTTVANNDAETDLIVADNMTEENDLLQGDGVATNDVVIENGNAHQTSSVDANNRQSSETNNGLTGGQKPDNSSTTITTNDEERLGTNTPNDESNMSRLNARFNSETTTACAGKEFIFTPEELNQNAIYVWDFGDGTYSTGKIGSHTYKKSGNYVVGLTLKDTKSNKSLSTSTIDVVVNPQPNTNFTWEKSNDAIPTVNFINLTEEAQNWAWDIKGLKTSTQNQFEYTFRKQGNYMVELTATNEFGCQKTLQKQIEIENDYNLLAPTAFSPDGDGNNDNFIPKALLIMDVPFTMVIYDKSGAHIAQTTSAFAPWNGMNMNDNSACPDGAYVWTVQFKNANGEMEYYQGQVIITR